MARAKGSFAKRLLWTLAIVLVLGAGAWGAANLLLPRAKIAADLERTLSDRLGRPVKIRGGVNPTLWPVAGIEARDVHIANLPGGAAPDLISAEAFDVGVSPQALLSGRVEVRRLLLRRPVVRLEKAADGTVNWKLGSGAPKAAGLGWLKDLRLEQVSVEGGVLSYLDGASGKRQDLDQLDLSFALDSLDRPLKVEGGFWWKGRSIRLDLDLAQPRLTLAGEAAPVGFSLKSELLTLRLDGALDPAAGQLVGRFDASGPSLRALSAWTGKAMGSGKSLGAFALNGRLTRQGTSLKLEGAQIALDHLRASGDLDIDLSRPRAYASGQLYFAVLDLNPYLGPEGPPGAGWSTTPIDLSGLSAFDADLQLSAGAVAWRRVKLTGVGGSLALNGGQADIRIERMALYGGSGSGRVVLSQGGRSARAAFALNLSGVQARPLLTDLAALDRIEGTARLNANLAGAGANQAQIMKGLAGTATVEVASGSIRGADLAAVSRQVTSVLSGQAVGANARTSFSTLSADFTVSGGVASTSNLRLVTAAVTLNGVGRIDLGNQALDLSIKPQGAAKLGGRSLDLSAVPFRVSGPWSKLAFTPDLKGLAEAELRGKLGQALGGDDSSGIGGLLKGLGGKGTKDQAPTDGSAPAPARKKNPLKDALGGLAH